MADPCRRPRRRAARRTLSSLDDLLAPDHPVFPRQLGWNTTPVECPLLDTASLLRFADPNPSYPDTNIGDKHLCSGEGGDLDEWDPGYHSLEFDLNSDYGLPGSVLESSTLASCCGAGASDWPSPYQAHASAATLLKFAPQGSPPFRLLAPCALLQPAWSRDEPTPEISLWPGF